MTLSTRIVVVDDHQLFRTGLIEILQTVDGFHIVAEGATGVEAITLAHDAKPEVLILDVEMPGPGAAATIRKILDASPSTRIVVLTMHDDADIVRSLLEAGASGYLLKSAGRTELIAAINTAARHDSAILLSVSRNTAMSLARGASPPPSPPNILSPREHEVLALLAAAKTNHDIATSLYITDGTVKRHLANIYAKLGAASRMDAVRKGIQLGVISNTFAGDPMQDR